MTDVPTRNTIQILMGPTLSLVPFVIAILAKVKRPGRGLEEEKIKSSGGWEVRQGGKRAIGHM